MKPHRMRREPGGFTLIALLVLVATLAVLFLAVLPKLDRHPRNRRLPLWCMNNLRQVGVSFALWAQDNGDQYPMQTSTRQGGTAEWLPHGLAYVHFRVLSNYLQTPRPLFCNYDKERRAATSFAEFDNANLSYFICTSATFTTNRQAQHLLAGDSDITVGGQLPPRRMVTLTTNQVLGWSGHRHPVKGAPAGGNLLFSDAHVEFVRSDRLQSRVQGSSPTHTLVIP